MHNRLDVALAAISPGVAKARAQMGGSPVSSASEEDANSDAEEEEADAEEEVDADKSVASVGPTTPSGLRVGQSPGSLMAPGEGSAS